MGTRKKENIRGNGNPYMRLLLHLAGRNRTRASHAAVQWASSTRQYEEELANSGPSVHSNDGMHARELMSLMLTQSQDSTPGAQSGIRRGQDTLVYDWSTNDQCVCTEGVAY